MTFVPGITKLSHEEKLWLFLNRLEGAEKARADAAFLGLAEAFDLQPHPDSSYHESHGALLVEAAPTPASLDTDVLFPPTQGLGSQSMVDCLEANQVSRIVGFSENVATDLLEANQNDGSKIPLPEKVISTNGVRLLACNVGEPLLFYVDSGAGQCLCSNDSSFVDMTPCMVEITGIAGALQIYG